MGKIKTITNIALIVGILTVAQVVNATTFTPQEEQPGSIQRDVYFGYFNVMPYERINNTTVYGKFGGVLSTNTAVLPHFLHGEIGAREQFLSTSGVFGSIGMDAFPGVGVSNIHGKVVINATFRRFELNAGLMLQGTLGNKSADTLTKDPIDRAVPIANVGIEVLNSRNNRLYARAGTFVDRNKLSVDSNGNFLLRPNIGPSIKLNYTRRISDNTNINAWVIGNSSMNINNRRPVAPSIQAGVSIDISGRSRRVPNLKSNLGWGGQYIVVDR